MIPNLPLTQTERKLVRDLLEQRQRELRRRLRKEASVAAAKYRNAGNVGMDMGTELRARLDELRETERAKIEVVEEVMVLSGKSWTRELGRCLARDIGESIGKAKAKIPTLCDFRRIPVELRSGSIMRIQLALEEIQGELMREISILVGKAEVSAGSSSARQAQISADHYPTPHGEPGKRNTMHQANGPRKPRRLFYSYAHEDEDLREKLETHLSPLKREGLIVDWHDRRIVPSHKLHDEIAEQLETADIILLLVSSDFIASDYSYEKEMTRALELHEVGTVRVVPVILRPCDWQRMPFRELCALPTDGKPITSDEWATMDDAFTDVAAGIRTLVTELAGEASTPRQ